MGAVAWVWRHSRVMDRPRNHHGHGFQRVPCRRPCPTSRSMPSTRRILTTRPPSTDRAYRSHPTRQSFVIADGTEGATHRGRPHTRCDAAGRWATVVFPAPGSPTIKWRVVASGPPRRPGFSCFCAHADILIKGTAWQYRATIEGASGSPESHPKTPQGNLRSQPPHPPRSGPSLSRAVTFRIPCPGSDSSGGSGSGGSVGSRWVVRGSCPGEQDASLNGRGRTRFQGGLLALPVLDLDVGERQQTSPDDPPTPASGE